MTKGQDNKEAVFERAKLFMDKVDNLKQSKLSEIRDLVWLLQAQREKIEIIKQNFDLNYNRYLDVRENFAKQCNSEDYSWEPIAKDGATLIDYVETLLQNSIQFINSVCSTMVAMLEIWEEQKDTKEETFTEAEVMKAVNSIPDTANLFEELPMGKRIKN